MLNCACCGKTIPVSSTLGVVRKERAPFLRYSFLHTLDCFAAPHPVGVRPSSHSVPPVRR